MTGKKQKQKQKNLLFKILKEYRNHLHLKFWSWFSPSSIHQAFNWPKQWSLTFSCIFLSLILRIQKPNLLRIFKRYQTNVFWVEAALCFSAFLKTLSSSVGHFNLSPLTFILEKSSPGRNVASEPWEWWKDISFVLFF